MFELTLNRKIIKMALIWLPLNRSIQWCRDVRRVSNGPKFIFVVFPVRGTRRGKEALGDSKQIYFLEFVGPSKNTFRGGLLKSRTKRGCPRSLQNEDNFRNLLKEDSFGNFPNRNFKSH